MAVYLTRRLFLAVPTVFGVLLAVFLLIRLVPGDVVTRLVGLEATISPQRVDELRRLFELDRPLLTQFTESTSRPRPGCWRPYRWSSSTTRRSTKRCGRTWMTGP